MTDAGRQAALEAGAALAANVRGIFSSPLRRCMETAEALRQGCGLMDAVRVDQRLGGPGAFVDNPVLAGESLCRLGLGRFGQWLMEGTAPQPGLRDPATAAKELAAHLLAHIREDGVVIFVSHDLILAPLLARMRGRALEAAEWPGFLEGMTLWREDGSAWLLYRGQVTGTRGYTESPCPTCLSVV